MMRKEITEDQITALMLAMPRAEEVDRLRAEVERLRASNKRLHRALFRIAGKAPFADDPWTIAAKALKREAKP